MGLAIGRNVYCLEDIKNRLLQAEPITQQEIKNFWEVIENPAITKAEKAEFFFDRSHTLYEIVSKLYRGVFFSKEEYCDTSSTGALKIIDNESLKTLFYSKPSSLPENMGVPRDGAVPREHLYYLLDRGFAGVPPAIRVLTQCGVRTFHVFKDNCTWFRDRTKQRKASLRKCVIHQYRMVNMDPSDLNILIPNKDGTAALPIDGGYCLPESMKNVTCHSFSIGDDKALLERPYLDEPFTEEEKDYIKKIDIDSEKNFINLHMGKKNLRVLTIFQIANILLKQAADYPQGEQASITLHDLCIIRNISLSNEGSVFQQLSSCPESDILQRISDLFNKVIEIKTAIHSCKGENLDESAVGILNTIDEQNRLLRKIAAQYVLGANEYCRILKSPRESLIKNLLKIIEYNRL